MESNQQQNRDNLRNLEVKEYQYKDKINLNDKKLWLLLGIIILSLIIFFIILANTNDNFSPLVLLALTLPWVVIIVCFIAVYVLIKKRVPVVANMRENHIQLIKESKIMDSLSYSEATKKLTVRKRSKYLNEFVSAVPIVIDSSTKKPDSLVFTSATVGGVTTGGIERVEGKTTTRRTFSGLYRLVFKNMKDDGTFFTVGEVEFIELPKKLLEKAKSELNDYIYHDKIAVLDEKIKKNKNGRAGTEMMRTMLLKSETDAANDYRLFEVIEYPDNEKISKIINWLCEEEENTVFSYNRRNEKDAFAEENREPSANEWKCPKCGRINQNYVGSCGCGERKP